MLSADGLGAVQRFRQWYGGESVSYLQCDPAISTVKLWRTKRGGIPTDERH